MVFSVGCESQAYSWSFNGPKGLNKAYTSIGQNVVSTPQAEPVAKCPRALPTCTMPTWRVIHSYVDVVYS